MEPQEDRIETIEHEIVEISKVVKRLENRLDTTINKFLLLGLSLSVLGIILLLGRLELKLDEYKTILEILQISGFLGLLGSLKGWNWIKQQFKNSIDREIKLFEEDK